jgi:hypothetical protein
MIAVSDSNVRSFSLADLSATTQDADVVIDTCTPDDITGYGAGGAGGPGWGEGDVRQPYACSSSRGGAGGLLLVGIALAISVRRGSRSGSRRAARTSP